MGSGGSALSFRSDDLYSILVRGDETKLGDVIGNPVDNAIKYTTAGGITAEVTKRDRKGRITVALLFGPIAHPWHQRLCRRR
jgi:signal transduction histidine kinase